MVDAQLQPELRGKHSRKYRRRYRSGMRTEAELVKDQGRYDWLFVAAIAGLTWLFGGFETKLGWTFHCFVAGAMFAIAFQRVRERRAFRARL